MHQKTSTFITLVIVIMDTLSIHQSLYIKRHSCIKAKKDRFLLMWTLVRIAYTQKTKIVQFLPWVRTLSNSTKFCLLFMKTMNSSSATTLSTIGRATSTHFHREFKKEMRKQRHRKRKQREKKKVWERDEKSKYSQVDIQCNL